MKKSIYSVLLLFILLVTLVSCSAPKGNIENVNIDYGKSSIYSQDEIATASKCILDYFSSEFYNCTLTYLWYSEEMTVEANLEHSNEKTIVFNSTFYTDAEVKNGFSPDEIYSDWHWKVSFEDGKWDIGNYGML